MIVCKGPSCSLLGGEALLDWCRDLEAAGLPVEYEVSGCSGNCMESPVAQWNGRYLTECSPEKLTEELIRTEPF